MIIQYPFSTYVLLVTIGCGKECNLAHHRSVAELFMLFKINSNPMHPLSGVLPLPYVPARVRGALVAHRHSFAPPCCRIFSVSQKLCAPLCVYLERS